MKIWVTRPNAYELYMGGWRSCVIHLVKPFYDHRVQGDGNISYEYGWYYGNHHGQRCAKDFLQQDQVIMKRVWDEIIHCTLPPNTDLSKLDDKSYVELYEQLFDDKEFELKSRVNYKRTLIEVDLHSKIVVYVVPEVLYEDSTPRIETLEISVELAVSSSWPREPSDDDIPF